MTTIQVVERVDLSLGGRSKQIRSSDRVRNLGEVFTAGREVRRMVSMWVEAASDRIVDARVLEPSCGTCNFLSVVLAPLA